MNEPLRPDLLREHRLALGLPALPPPLRPARGLLLAEGRHHILLLIPTVCREQQQESLY